MPPKGGVETPLDASIIGRMVNGVKTSIAGAVTSWFGPLQPLQPVAPPDVIGRLWNYSSGYNLQTTPRPFEGGVYTALRELSKVDMIRLLIETRKDQLEALPWEIRVKEGKKGDYDKKIAEITAFLQQPDGYHSWHQWMRKLIEDLLVIDAPTIYKRRNRGGKLIALDVVDGATIAVKIDQYGRVPVGTGEVAFQQLLQGVPATDYSTDDMIFAPRNVRSHTVYGFSPVEQIALTINIVLRRMQSQLEMYDTSNLPPGLIELPVGMNQAELDSFMKALNARLSGNIREQQKLYPVPSGTKYQEIKKPSLVEQMVEEWFARVCCFAFSISPQPFVKEVNRATAKTAQDAAFTEGLSPLMMWLKRLMDQIIVVEFGAPDLEFGWQDDKEQDPLVQSQVFVAYAKAAIFSIDEVRNKLSEAPLGGAFAVPQVLTATGYVAVKSPEEQDAAAQQQQEAQQVANEAKTAALKSGKPGEPGDKKPKDSAAIVEKSAPYGALRKAGGSKPAPLAPKSECEHPHA